MQIAIFVAKFASLLRRGTQYELALARLSYRRVAALDDLKWVFHRLHMIEPQRSSFVEIFKKSWVDEVAHGKAVNPEVIGLDGVAHLVSERRTLAGFTQRIVSGTDQRLGKLVRCGQADFVADAEPRPPGQHGFHEYEQDGPALEKWKAETCLACLPNIFFRSWRRFLTS